MPTNSASLTPARLLQLMQRHRSLLIAPAVAGAVIAALSTLVLPRDWKATQGLVIRSDAAGYTDQRLGKFTDLSEMKTVQETLLELARSQSVVTAVLSEVLGKEPSRQDIADFRDKLRLNPPGGAEFGKTEVFYVGVLNPNRDRAIAMVKSLTRQLDLRLNELRNERASSLVAEVERSVAIAREQLHKQAETLAAFEGSIGADLIELRHLTSPNGGQSELGQKVLAIESERRQSVDRRRQNEALLNELQTAVENPSRILATPDALLSGQPALRRLKNGLVDAQLVVARTAGTRTPNHPLVVAARHSQQAVQKELVRELPSAIAGVELELQVSQRREEELAAQIAQLRDRSAGLAGQRSEYAELVANVEGQTAVLERSLKQLADAKAARGGANSSSLLASIDEVETGVHPVGPGRTTVTAAGGMAGLLLGATLVFVFYAPPTETPAVVLSRTPTRGPAAAPSSTPPTAARVEARPALTPAPAPAETPAQAPAAAVQQPQPRPAPQPAPRAQPQPAPATSELPWAVEIARATADDAAKARPVSPLTTVSTVATTPTRTFGA
ncbi:hypothetical protein Pla108_37920 [Botrimarina colliarenosi]|uniref:Chain length determinant protein n=1 Tax=Botrimarina colliarenosi TaxID=2528001 RepID=A0A5C6A3V6_9BACT|nr:hypothetical protein [Botrimarina colliarenosi]TWT94080.1 hypothetical protein Pla108_37920 [Botrimarina colliarenosi]